MEFKSQLGKMILMTPNWCTTRTCFWRWRGRTRPTSASTSTTSRCMGSCPRTSRSRHTTRAALCSTLNQSWSPMRQLTRRRRRSSVLWRLRARSRNSSKTWPWAWMNPTITRQARTQACAASQSLTPPTRGAASPPRASNKTSFVAMSLSPKESSKLQTLSASSSMRCLLESTSATMTTRHTG